MRYIATSDTTGYFMAESEDERRAMEDAIREEGKFWKGCGCHCENPSVYYVEDGDCTVRGCGVHKHHWHCAKCHGIVQIG